MTVTVLVADRHAGTRAGIRAALETAGFAVCAEAGDAAEAVTAAERTRPDVCLVDLELPGGGLTATRAIAGRAGAPAVVVLGGTARDLDLFAALRAGAAGFVVKDVDPRRLPDAIATAAAGGAPLSPRLTARLVDEFRALGRGGGGSLSPREREALGLLADGLSTKEIAARLGIAAATARRHIASALRKLGVEGRAAGIASFRSSRGSERE